MSNRNGPKLPDKQKRIKPNLLKFILLKSQFAMNRQSIQTHNIPGIRQKKGYRPISRRFRINSVRSLIVMLVFLLASCSTDDRDDSSANVSPALDIRTVRVETIEVKPQAFEDIIALIGIVQSPNDAKLSAQSRGTLVFREPLGTSVKKGGVVARTEATVIEAVLIQAKASLEAAEADAEFAEDTFKRQEPLYQDSIISALEYEQFRAQLNAARAQLARNRAVVAQSEKELENTYIISPFSGIVEEHFAEPGEHVSIGTPVIRVVDTQILKIIAGVPERYARDIRVGEPVAIRFKAYGTEERSGTISFVGSVIDPMNRSFMIEILLDNTDGDLKPEMIADVFLARSHMVNQVVIPQTAILRDETGNSVYIVNRSSGTSVAERKKIELGASSGGKTVVTNGLSPGDEVIVVGQTRVTEGDAVDAVQSESVMS